MTAFLLTLASVLPEPLRGLVTDARIRLLVQFGMFGIVGLIGFTIDTATVYALRHATGLYVAGMLAYFTAATGTWFFNRLWTFRGMTGTEPWYVQWFRFLLANLSGFVVNRGVYVILVTFVAAAAREPVIATFSGAVAGMTINFNLSRKMVFRAGG
jgi:putative flippase GtrA